MGFLQWVEDLAFSTWIRESGVWYGYALILNEIHSFAQAAYRERRVCRVDPGWMPRLKGVHSYSRVGDWEAIDGGFAF